MSEMEPDLAHWLILAGIIALLILALVRFRVP
jgi:hypothetical protein